MHIFNLFELSKHIRNFLGLCSSSRAHLFSQVHSLRICLTHVYSDKVDLVSLLFLPLFAENLLLTADQRTVKLVDLGLAREETLTEMMTAETGTYRWMAPEVSIIASYLSVFRSFIFRIIIDVSWNASTVVQHSYVEAWRKEALQPQSRCLQLCNCAVGTPSQ